MAPHFSLGNEQAFLQKWVSMEGVSAVEKILETQKIAP